MEFVWFCFFVRGNNGNCLFLLLLVCVVERLYLVVIPSAVIGLTGAFLKGSRAASVVRLRGAFLEGVKGCFKPGNGLFRKRSGRVLLR